MKWVLHWEVTGMINIRELLGFSKEQSTSANITIYPVGTRVPRNNQVEKIIKNVFLQSSTHEYNKFKKTI
jgi:hypothetical protein